MPITTPGAAALAQPGDRNAAITPDGSRVAYHRTNQLLLRALNRFEPTVLSALPAPPEGIFISPDGQWVGFFDRLTMKKVAIAGGAPLTVAVTAGNARGATWNEDGQIIFATSILTTGLQHVPATGGEPMVLTMPDRGRGEGDHLWPEFLPGGGDRAAPLVVRAPIAVRIVRPGEPASQPLLRMGRGIATALLFDSTDREKETP